MAPNNGLTPIMETHILLGTEERSRARSSADRAAAF